MPTPTTRPLRALLAALVVTAVSVAVGVLLVPGSPPADRESPHARVPVPASSTPPTDLDTSALVVRRAPFCTRVPPDRVAAALGAEAVTTTSYADGETAQLTEGVRDVAHEHGCSWSAAGGAEASAWVFAPPVTVARARALVREAAGAAGCRAVPEAKAFGTVSLARVCRSAAAREASYRGLFGDAWLACSLTLPLRGSSQERLLERTEEWCAAVAVAAAPGAPAG